jgi:hypothetical protein
MDAPAPELASIDAFAEYLVEDDRVTFTFHEAEELAEALKLSCPTPVIRGLREYGLIMEERPVTKRVRGFTSSNHDRYYGPGSSSSHGGSGWEQISGFAGDEG